MMNEARWQKIEELFNATLALPEHQRDSFLYSACDGDADLRSQVESLISEANQPDQFFSQPAFSEGARLLTQQQSEDLTGRTFGAYRILNLVGRGGMGEVYCATDARLGRRVALKVLPKAFSTNTDRLRRFEQEARAASAVNHPNITAVYDIGSQDGSPYIVSEFLEGETLRARLRNSALPTRKAIEYALQIASGLAAAHEKGIVHRDLKPENIFITKEGRAKILDFGLAKLVQPQLGKETLESATQVPSFDTNAGSDATSSAQGDASAQALSEADTTQGVVLGTAAYMSPEQVRGGPIDHRTDIFSFGSVLFEMLTGHRPFRGHTSAEAMKAILGEDPPEEHFRNARISSAIARVVHRCLEKNPDERFHSARDLAFALEVLSSETMTSAPETPRPATERRLASVKVERIVWIAVVVMLCVALVGIYFIRPTTVRNPARFSFPLPERTSRITSLSLSPDGRYVAFVATIEGRAEIWLRAIDSLAAQPLAGTDGALNFFWSPDSKFIGFFSGGKLKRIDTAGGPAEILCDAPEGRGGTWSRDGNIIFAPQPFTPLYSIAASGGAASEITSLNAVAGENSHRWPYFLPDGRHLVFFVRTEKPETSGIWVGSLGSTARKFLFSSESAAVYSPAGYLLFLRQKTLMAQKFDAASLQISGEPIPVADDVGYARNLNERQGYFSVSDSGVLAYSAGLKDSRHYVWFDRAGKETGTTPMQGDIRDMALSPDGKRVAVQFIDNRTGVENEDIWLMDLQRNLASRFTFTPAVEDFPVWSPHSDRLVFHSTRAGAADLYQCDYSRAGKEELLLKSDRNKNPTDWSADGRYILYENLDANGKIDMWVLPTFEDKKPFPFLVTEFNESQGHWSPDGKWIAYVSDESGTDEIYIQSFPAGAEKLLVSSGGGRQPLWSRDGKELFYFAPGGKLMILEIRRGARLEASTPRMLFETRVDNYAASNRYAISPDGQRLLINSPSEDSAPRPIVVVMDWAAGVK